MCLFSSRHGALRLPRSQSKNIISDAHDVPAADTDDDSSMFPVNANFYDLPDNFGAMYELPRFEPSLCASFLVPPEVGIQELSITSPPGTTEEEGFSSGTGLVPWSQTGLRLSPLNEEYAPSAYVTKPMHQQYSKPRPWSLRILFRKSIADKLRRDLLRELTESVDVAAWEASGEDIDTSAQVPSTAEVQDFSRLFELEVARALAALDNAPLEREVGSWDDDWDQDNYDDDCDF